MSLVFCSGQKTKDSDYLCYDVWVLLIPRLLSDTFIKKLTCSDRVSHIKYVVCTNLVLCNKTDNVPAVLVEVAQNPIFSFRNHKLLCNLVIQPQIHSILYQSISMFCHIYSYSRHRHSKCLHHLETIHSGHYPNMDCWIHIKFHHWFQVPK